ncbi:MAG: hypothetical protein RBQ91_02285 [Acholeplasma sp.]|nr:hypothetical protein [Acholeplasma sp.]
MTDFIEVTKEPYTWGLRVNEQTICIYVEAEHIPRLVHQKKNGLYFTLNDSRILAIIIDGSSFASIDFDSTDEMIKYFVHKEANNDFSQFKAWCNKCLLKASNYKSLALYQVLFKSGSNQPKHNESNASSVKQQTELAFEVR